MKTGKATIQVWIAQWLASLFCAFSGGVLLYQGKIDSTGIIAISAAIMVPWGGVIASKIREAGKSEPESKWSRSDPSMLDDGK